MIGFRLLSKQGAVTFVIAVLIVLQLTIGQPVHTQAINEQFHFQGRLRNASQGIVPDGDYNMYFRITDGGDGCNPTTGTPPCGGTVVWTEEYKQTNRVRVENGYFSVQLNSITNDLSTVDFTSNTLWLSIDIGGTTDTPTPTYDGQMEPFMRFSSTPYALNARELGGRLASDFVQLNPGASPQTISTTNTAINVQQTGTGDLLTLDATNTGSDGVTIDIQDNSSSRYALSVTSNNGTTQGLYVRADGNVGIGTASPRSRVDISSGNLDFSGTSPAFYTSGGAASLSIGGGRTSPQAGNIVFGNGTGWELAFALRSDNAATKFLTIQDDGDILFNQYDCSANANGGALTVNGSGVVICSDDEAGTGGDGGVTTVSAIDSQTKSANGAVISGSNIYLQTADASSVGLVSTGTQTFAGNKTFNGSVVLAASQSLTLTGGNTASRPGSPTEGMIYFDTDTDTLLTYANGKWQATTGEYVIVAASNSSQAIKDAAHYVADGNTVAANDGDQIQINQALTAAAGGKVYLAVGTYVADATILIPNNTTLAGAGRGTLIELADLDATDNLIENSDSTTKNATPGTGITIQDLRLDGRDDLNTAGNQNGIALDDMGSGTGSSAIQGAKLTNLWVNNFRSTGFYLSASSNNTFTGNTAQGNGYGFYIYSGSNNNTFIGNIAQGNASEGFTLDTSSYNTLTGNIAQGNASVGILLYLSSYNTLTGNTAQGNGYGFDLGSSSNNTFTGNTIQGNWVGFGFAFSSYNTLTGNTFSDNGGATDNDAIYLNIAADFNTITGNTITDSSCTTTCYAIWIVDATSDNNYLANNTLGGGTINDAGTGTIYGGQVNGSGNYVIQPAGTIELLKNTNITGNLDVSGTLKVGTADAFQINSSGAITAATGITSSGTITFSGLSTAGIVTNTAGGVLGTVSSIPIANGGTGANTAQGAINAISGLTTNGDLLYHNGSNSTRLARGSAGQCLTSDASTLVWGACAGGVQKIQQSFQAYNINQAASATTASNLLMPTAATTFSVALAGTTEFKVNSNGSFKACSILSSAAVTGGSVSVRFRKNGADASGTNYCTLNTTDTRSKNDVVNSGTVTFAAGDTIGVALVSSTLAPTTLEFAINFTVEYDSGGTATNLSLQSAYDGGNTITTTNARDLSVTLADTATDSNMLINIASGSTGKFAVQNNGTDVLRVTSSGTVINTGGLTVSTAGITVTGNSTIAGTLGSLTGLTSSGTITFSGLSSTGVVQTNGSGVLSTGNLNLGSGPVTGTLGVSNGGTGQVTLQAAINSLSGLTTNGDLLYHNGTNAVRLARGSDTQCLTSNTTTILWGSCGSGVDTTGTPIANQIAYFSDADTIQGSASFTFDGADLNVDSNTLFVDGSADRIGIGTASPSAKLDIQANSASIYAASFANASLTGNGVNIEIAEGSGTYNALRVVTNTSDAIIDAFLIDSAGNIGIGDFSPIATLTVGNGDLFQVEGASGNITTAGTLAVNGGNISSTTALTLQPNAGSNLNISLSGTGDLAVNTNQLYVDTSTGNVGIGLTNPNELLTVNGRLSLQETTSPGNTSGYGKLFVKSSDSHLYFRDDSGTETDLTLAGNCSSCATTALDNLASTAINADLLPDTDDTYNLGSSTLRWQDLYLGPNTLHIGTSSTDESLISYNTTSNSLIVKPAASNDSTSAVQIQSASGTEVLTVDSVNSATILRGTNSDATLGAEKVTNGSFTGSATGWTLGTGWAYDSNDVSKTPGTASALEQNISAVSGETYLINFYISWGAGCVTPRLGGVWGSPVCEGGYQYQVITATGTGNLQFNADSSFDADIDDVSVKKVTLVNAPLQIKNSSGTTAFELRVTGNSQTANTLVGVGAGQSNITGKQLTAFGFNALRSNTIGQENVAIGDYALQRNTWGTENVALGSSALWDNSEGHNNTALGAYTLSSNVNGDYNTGVGSYSLSDNTFGHRNTAIGLDSLSSNTTGSNNIALGYGAGINITTGSNNLIIGYNISAQSATASNQLSIGNLLFSNGINGTGTTVSTGNLGIGTTSPDRKLDVLDASNPQLRLTHTDGSVYSDLQTNASGYLNILPSGNRITIGTSDTTGTLLVVDTKTDATDPTGTDGAIYYNSNLAKFRCYENGAWKDCDDASADTFIAVAANDSSAEIKNAADYVADGTSDQSEINSALTAAAGGKVYLAAGTYTADGTIFIKNSTTLTGAGRGTVIRLNVGSDSDNLIENEDTVTGTDVTISDLTIDGSLGTGGVQEGIYFNNMGGGSGASARSGAQITNILAKGFRTRAIYLVASSNNFISENIVRANNVGIWIDGSNNTLTGNLVQGNVTGVTLPNGSNNSVFGNTSEGNSIGFSASSSNNTFNGNNAYNNSNYGFSLPSGSANNTISGNNIKDSGGSTANNGIYLASADSNTITSNTITDASATTTNYAINVSDSGSDTNYISNNTLGGGSVNDVGTGTVYGGQVSNTSGDFAIQPAGNVSIGTLTSDAKLEVLATSTSTTAGTLKGGELTVTDTGIVTTGTDTTYGQRLVVTRTGATGGTINTYGLDIQATGSTGGTSTLTGLNINVSGADTNYAALFNGGNVGIGTSSPSALFHVDGGLFGATGVDSVLLKATDSISTSLDGNNITLLAGDNTSEAFSGTGANGGEITLQGGYGADASEGGTSGDGGKITIQAGAGGIASGGAGSGVGGNLVLNAGTGTTPAYDGIVQIAQNGTSATITTSTSGNLGVGTSSPQEKLHIYQNISSAPVTLEIENADVNSNAVIRLKVASTTKDTKIEFGDPGDDNAGQINYRHSTNSFEFDTNGLTRVAIDSAGRMGIATTPSAWHSSYTGVLQINRSSITEFNSIQTDYGRNYYYDGGYKYIASAVATRYSQQSTGDHIWNHAVSGTAGSALTWSELMRLTGSGNVGIGTATPDTYVTAGTGLVVGTGNAASTGEISVLGDQTTDGVLGQFNFRNDANSGNRQVVLEGYRSGANNSGEFRIYTSNAGTLGQRLTVSSTGSVRFNSYGAGTLVTDGSGNITASSDARLKNIQGNFNRGLDDILKLNPKTYKWNGVSGLETTSTYAGFIAQDVQGAIPEAIGQDSRGYLTLQDRPILAASVNAIKELDSRIKTLEQSLGNQANANYLKNGDAASFSSLNVSGTTTLNGNLVVKGNTTISKDLLVKGKLTVNNDLVAKANLYVEGKLVSRGVAPSVNNFVTLGSPVNGAGVELAGTDVAGTISLTTASDRAVVEEGEETTLTEVTFNQAYTAAPRIALTPKDGKSARLPVFVKATSDGFKIIVDTTFEADTTYEFDYIIIASENISAQ